MYNLKALVIAIATLPALTFAAENKVVFEGNITEQTCTVSIDGQSGTSTVTLPTLSTSDLQTAGTGMGYKAFTVNVSGCTAVSSGDTALNTVFNIGSPTASGNINNQGTAKNVEVQLRDTKQNVIDFTGGTSAIVPGLVIKQGETNASAQFEAGYYTPTGQVTAGTVSASAMYYLAYP